MGMFCGLGAILLTHLTASEREPAAVRVAAAAALPVVAVTLYFTFSRGAIAATIVGLVLYMVLAHPRGLIGALPAVGLPVAFALQQAYGAELLARDFYAGAGAREEGRALLEVVIGCVVAAAALRGARAARRPAAAADPHRAARAPRRVRGRGGGRRCSRSWSRPSRSTCPARFDEQHEAFVGRADHRAAATTCETRLTKIRQQRPPRDLAGGARRGHGASVARVGRRDVPARLGATAAPTGCKVIDGPLALLRDAGRARLDRRRPARDRARGPARRGGLPAPRPGPARLRAFIAAGVALVLHANVDWDWEMPALFIWFFGAAGVVLAAPVDARRPPARAAPPDAPARRPRVPAGRADPGDGGGLAAAAQPQRRRRSIAATA